MSSYNQPAFADAETELQTTLLAEQPVSIVGRPPVKRSPFRFPEHLAGEPIVVPARGSSIRSAFDALLGRARVEPKIIAEIDDMAMLRLMARESGCLALVPPVVVVDELKAGTLVERCRIADLREEFYAITRQRKLPNPLVVELLGSRRDSGTAPPSYGKSCLLMAGTARCRSTRASKVAKPVGWRPNRDSGRSRLTATRSFGRPRPSEAVAPNGSLCCGPNMKDERRCQATVTVDG